MIIQPDKHVKKGVPEGIQESSERLPHLLYATSITKFDSLANETKVEAMPTK